MVRSVSNGEALPLDAPASIRVSESTVIAPGAVWDVRRDRFDFGSSELVRDYLDHPGAVGIVALDTSGRVLLLQQYRHPIGQRDWEIPAGLMDVPGETGWDAARRELAEEADLSADRWDLLLDVYLSPGSSSEAMRIFLAREVFSVDVPHERSEEEAEIVPTWVPLGDAVSALLSGRIANGVTAQALLAAHVARERSWRDLRDPLTPWLTRDRARGERSAR